MRHTVWARSKVKPKKIKPLLWSVEEADARFSQYVRERDKHICKRCGKVYKKGARGLTCSHFWGRQHAGGRFHPDNADAVCWMPCHKYYWEKEKQGAYRDFKLKQLGPVRYAALEKRARGTYQMSTAIIELMQRLGALK